MEVCIFYFQIIAVYFLEKGSLNTNFMGYVICYVMSHLAGENTQSLYIFSLVMIIMTTTTTSGGFRGPGGPLPPAFFKAADHNLI